MQTRLNSLFNKTFERRDVVSQSPILYVYFLYSFLVTFTLLTLSSSYVCPKGRFGPPGTPGPRGPTGNPGRPGQFGRWGLRGKLGYRGACGPRGKSGEIFVFFRNVQDKFIKSSILTQYFEQFLHLYVHMYTFIHSIHSLSAFITVTGLPFKVQYNLTVNRQVGWSVWMFIGVD